MLYDITDADLIEGVLHIKTQDGFTLCIPEQDCTAEQAELFIAWRNMYPNGKQVPIEAQQPVYDNISEDEIAMAEALIDLDTRLSVLEVKLNG